MLNTFKGETFSLYGNETDSDNYYLKISEITDSLLPLFNDERDFLTFLKNYIPKKHQLKEASKNNNGSLLSSIIITLKNELSIYTEETKNHLNKISFKQRWNRVISTSEEQYHLYMVEIELANRIYAKQFKQCEYKIALLPHCLHDLSRECLSKPAGIDYKCKGCSKVCYINQVNKILTAAGVDAYIWLTADLKKLFKELHVKYKTIGVLGIACIPELANGINSCLKFGLPVIGLPLDANRCKRWMGDFNYNTVNLNKLKEIVC